MGRPDDLLGIYVRSINPGFRFPFECMNLLRSSSPCQQFPAGLDRRSSVGKSAGNDATAYLKSSDEA